MARCLLRLDEREIKKKSRMRTLNGGVKGCRSMHEYVRGSMKTGWYLSDRLNAFDVGRYNDWRSGVNASRPPSPTSPRALCATHHCECTLNQAENETCGERYGRRRPSGAVEPAARASSSSAERCHLEGSSNARASPARSSSSCRTGRAARPAKHRRTPRCRRHT
jgi:hypothetical protein